MESEIDSKEELRKRIEKDKPRKMLGLNEESSADIILIHDHAETSEFFQEMIEKLLAKSIDFQPIPTEF